MQPCIVELTGLPNHRLVVFLTSEYLRDRSGVELAGGEFLMLGKVARKLAQGESIDLIRGSALAGMSDGLLRQLVQAFEQIGDQVFRLPRLTTRVDAPAMQVIPIAVCV